MTAQLMAHLTAKPDAQAEGLAADSVKEPVKKQVLEVAAEQEVRIEVDSRLV
eukprot:CAMPEP_0196753560 /NCGR_PEP_ID=MMETSP1091-20130531/91186_1 /TAXON_ID=302021 /ORGANISM="Rhodomonas sp., Strain CCMP768" /LENGTH=51 /DNA_ID=CAMNT_0042101693 /DNA_START=7 /DNA_END=158 /DNA_ORIENTATION=-